ncbi:hypothetical protein AE618_10750 [Bosea vaviloviae]|uniref:Uncharacterized protein n=1 Tax=Bosea vaviloviae TaxID=1526658 RepID=A0A0N1FIK7_9HYPH|nr:hypothetical protein AE618_10750 [Bosea vaviloviae]
MRGLIVEFSKANSIGSKSAGEIAAYLEAIGDMDAAARFLKLGAQSQAISVRFFTNDHWAYSGAQFGFIPTGSPGNSTEIAIDPATSVSADETLKGKAVKITLDRFYVHNYPGTGRHQIVCEFAGKNQAGPKSEELRFALKTTATDRSSAPLLSMPIFVDVNVGDDGLSFEGRTINVKSEGMETLVEALDSSAFKNGLALLTTSQPALTPFVQLAKGAVKAIEKQGNNKEVFSFSLGLDFSKTVTSAKLRLGSYVVVQTNETQWDWNNFAYNSQSGAVVAKADPTMPVELNYLIFGVTESGSVKSTG